MYQLEYPENPYALTENVTWDRLLELSKSEPFVKLVNRGLIKITKNGKDCELPNEEFVFHQIS